MQLHRLLAASLLTLILFTAWSVGQEQAAPKASVKTKTEGKKMESPANETVVMKTSLGSIKIELFADKAPITVKNFLRYIDDKFYDKTVFHRVIKNFMIQGGGFASGDTIRQKSVKEPIKNESSNGLKNDRGTIAMARTPDPNSATSQFFINVADNSSLNPGAADPHGYAVFGKVVEGMDVVDAIRSVATGSAPAIARSGNQEMSTMFRDVPVTRVVIESVRRLTR